MYWISALIDSSFQLISGLGIIFYIEMIWLRHFLKGVETLYCRIVPWNLMHMNRYNHIWSLFLSFTFNDSHFCNNSSLSKMVIGNNHCSPNRMSINALMFQIQLLLLSYVEKTRQKDKLSNAKFWKLNSGNSKLAESLNAHVTWNIKTRHRRA